MKIKVYTGIFEEKHGDYWVLGPREDFHRQLKEVYVQRLEDSYYWDIEPSELPNVEDLEDLLLFFDTRSDWEYERFIYQTREFEINEAD